jgi:hypothetical protein
MQMSGPSKTLRRRSRTLLVGGALALIALPAASVAAAATAAASSRSSSAQPLESAAIEQCVTSLVQAERSATFAGEMIAIAGTTRMAMRIELQERMPGDARYHTILAPGLGVWRASDAKVKIYKYLKQVTNLSSPASYRGRVSFRWLGGSGHVIRRAERTTPRCEQPASPPPAPLPPAMEAASAGTSAS